LEGKFSSLYANRVSNQDIDSFSRVLKHPFIAKGRSPGKVIVIADADVAMNE